MLRFTTCQGSSRVSVSLFRADYHQHPSFNFMIILFFLSIVLLDCSFVAPPSPRLSPARRDEGRHRSKLPTPVQSHPPGHAVIHLSLLRFHLLLPSHRRRRRRRRRCSHISGSATPPREQSQTDPHTPYETHQDSGRNRSDHPPLSTSRTSRNYRPNP